MANLERGGRLERVKADFFVGNTLKGSRRRRAIDNEAQERTRLLGKPTVEKGETPREDETQEGRGFLDGPKDLQEIRTLTGKKALKQGELNRKPFRQNVASANSAES